MLNELSQTPAGIQYPAQDPNQSKLPTTLPLPLPPNLKLLHQRLPPRILTQNIQPYI